VTNKLPAQRTAEEALTPTISQRLEQLAKEANEAHANVGSAFKNGLVCANQAGHALLEANRICRPLGQWLTWLAANFKASRWTARRYMDFAAECDRLGGMHGATLHHITPQEAGIMLKRLLVLPSGKKKAADQGQKALPGAAPVGAAASGQPAVNTAALELRSRPWQDAAGGPLPRLVELFEDLLAGLEVVVQGGDCHDGPFAEMLLMDLKTPYADLVEYLKDREQLQRAS